MMGKVALSATVLLTLASLQMHRKTSACVCPAYFIYPEIFMISILQLNGKNYFTGTILNVKCLYFNKKRSE